MSGQKFRAIPITSCKKCRYSHDWSSSGIDCEKSDPTRLIVSDGEREKLEQGPPEWCPLPLVKYC